MDVRQKGRRHSRISQEDEMHLRWPVSVNVFLFYFYAILLSYLNVILWSLLIISVV